MLTRIVKILNVSIYFQNAVDAAQFLITYLSVSKFTCSLTK